MKNNNIIIIHTVSNSITSKLHIPVDVHCIFSLKFSWKCCSTLSLFAFLMFSCTEVLSCTLFLFRDFIRFVYSKATDWTGGELETGCIVFMHETFLQSLIFCKTFLVSIALCECNLGNGVSTDSTVSSEFE